MVKSTEEPPLVRENRILSVRLSLAAAWTKFLLYAYDTLLHHGVSYRAIPEWKDKGGLLPAALDKHGTLEEGRVKILTYIERLTNGLTAAVRRKYLRPLNS
jgi:hypothetical protein